MATKIKIQNVVAPEELHPRAKLSEPAIEDYAQAMKDGVELPPIVVFQDERGCHLADGWHRLEAARRIGWKQITADVRKGSRRDALLYAVGANAKHGLRRTRADKRKAIQLLLDDPELQKWSVNQIAKACNVSWDLVEAVRHAYLPEPEDSERQVKRGDSVYNQKVGKRKKNPKPPPRTPLRAVGDMLTLVGEARLLAIKTGKQTDLADQLTGIAERLERLIGKQTGAKRLTKDLRLPLNVYERPRTDGIVRTPEFQKKGLATYAVNVGLGCGHGCYYCSSPSLRRTHPEFQRLEQTAFTTGIAIFDPKTPERLRQNIPTLTEEDVVQICTLDDAWSPEARQHNLGRQCLEVVLQETLAQVRVLTKSHHLREDFDLIRKHRDRVIVGLSTGTPVSHENLAQVIEPNASSISQRLAVLQHARKLRLRTFGMLCPVLPGIGDSREALEELFDSVLMCQPEAIWLEPVNARGKGLTNTSAALRLAGYGDEAAAIDHVRRRENWSSYTTSLIKTAIDVADRKGALGKLKILLYPKNLSGEHQAELEKFEQGIVWLLGENGAVAGDDRPPERGPATDASGASGMPKPKNKREVLTVRGLKKRYDEYFPVILEGLLLPRDQTKPRQQASYSVLCDLPSREEYERLKVEKYTTTVKSLMSESQSIVDELAAELEDIVSNMPENLQQTGVNQAREVAAEELRAIVEQYDEVPPEVEDLAIVFFPCLSASSRNARRAEAAEMLRTIADAVAKYHDKHPQLQKKAKNKRGRIPVLAPDSLDEFLEGLKDMIGGLEQIEFPGMFG